MSEEYDNTNSGACWPNDHKKTSSHPDYRGSLNVEGTDYWVSLWINTEAAGRQPPIKFKIREKDTQSETAAEPATIEVLEAIKSLARGPDADKPFDDDIPF